jgi:PAS domain S-box-containing protein
MRLKLLAMAEQLAGVGHWRYDMASGAAAWSSEMFRIHGLAPTAAAPAFEDILALYLPRDAERLNAAKERAITLGEGYTFEGRIRRPDGAIRHIMAKAQCQLDDSGRCTNLFGVLQDITDRVRSDRFTSTLLSELPNMAAYWAMDLTCVFANARYCEWFGRAPQRMIGRLMRELHGEAFYEANLAELKAVLRGEVRVFERSLTKPSGEFAHVLAQYVPEIDADGQVVGFFILITDLTALKTSQLRLEAANVALAKARDDAEAATQAKSEFLSNMSHELRTPLTSIIGFSSILAACDGLNTEAEDYVRLIRSASDALLSTINDILDFSKLEAGQVEIEQRAMDPAALGRSTLDLFQPQAEAKGLYRVFEGPGLPAQVMGDETRIKQILLNLISNAIKFTSVGGVALRCAYDPEQGLLRYEVADTGLGVSEERRSRLFQRFSQVDASTSRTFGGTGLGLAICRGLADAMGGRIGLDSLPNEGSTFWFEIPCSAETQGAPAPIQPEDFDLEAALSGLRVLVVDDNVSNLQLVRTLCQPFDIRTVEANGGSQAVTQAMMYSFDVILLDVRMPDVDGPTVARTLRSRPGPNQATPIIGFTADYGAEMPEEWVGLFDARLAKPISPIDLLMSLAAFSPSRRDPAGLQKAS